jgi:endoglycosylceramidase
MGAWLRAICVTTTVGSVLLAGCSAGGDDADGSGTRPEGVEPAAAIAELRPLSVAREGRPRIVDDAGRELLLRGANFNTLGDYYQDDPELSPTRPPTADDWDQMAANGFSVVRLVVSWSALEPERGELDQGYVARIRAAVDAAAARGIYTVIDFHQDAYGKYIATPAGTACPAGTEAAIGWDGAPEWATITDGASTCRPEGYREGAPAVHAAFRNFYDNTDGIRDAFVATVGRVAGEFAADPAVAGYDLLNEPNLVLPADESTARYTELVSDLVTAIRSAETEAGAASESDSGAGAASESDSGAASESGSGGFAHLIFLEPIVLFPLPGTMPSPGFTDDRDIVFAPHNYAESIGPRILTVEQTADVDAATAADRGWPLWIGEYGVFDTSEEKLDVLRRFAAAQDGNFSGSAVWQWRQHCGEPHTVGTPGNVAEGRVVQLNLVDCPGDRDGGPNEDALRVVGRAYPRAAPGELSELRSDPATGELVVAGNVDAGAHRDAELVVWVPGTDPPEADVEGLSEPATTDVDGGFYLTATPTADTYRLAIPSTSVTIASAIRRVGRAVATVRD